MKYPSLQKLVGYMIDNEGFPHCTNSDKIVEDFGDYKTEAEANISLQQNNINSNMSDGEVLVYCSEEEANEIRNLYPLTDKFLDNVWSVI